MWKKIYIGLILIAFAMQCVTAQTAPSPPADINIAVMQKIDQEHKTTRQFFSTELTRQRDEFYKSFDDRAAFYEQEFFDTLNSAVWKLSLLWGAIVLSIVGLSNMLRITLERKRFRRMKQAIKDELKVEMHLATPPKPSPQHQETIFKQSDSAAYVYKASPQAMMSEKDGYFASRKKRKLAREIEALEAARMRKSTEMQKMAMPAPPSASQMAAPGQLTAADIIRMTEQYNRELMQRGIDEQLRRAPQPNNRVEVYH
jgi:hypothetical protein